MIVIEKKPVPIYEVECPECKSRIQYRKSEVMTCHIVCPVCGISVWADTIRPVEDGGRVMTALEKVVERAKQIEYCDECEHFLIRGDAAFCKIDGKLIHPIMMVRGQGNGPARACQKRLVPKTHFDEIKDMTVEELAVWMNGIIKERNIEVTCDGWLNWLKSPAEEGCNG